MSGEDQLFQRFGRVCPPGTVLFREGEPGQEMFVVQRGEVRISRRSRDAEKVLALLGPGEIFGEMAIISSRPRTATAEVVREAHLLAIDARTFEAMVRGNAEIAVRLMKKFVERLADANAQIENLLLRDASSRVVHYLNHLARTQGRKEADGTHLEVNVAALPPMLGVGPEQVDEVLGKLARARICIQTGTGLVVPRLEQLQEFLDFLEMRQKFADLA